jgi:hypothetical protein
MSYQNDPNINRRRGYPMTEERSYTGWIVGAIVATAVVLSIFAMTHRTGTNAAANNNNSPATTTGSATNVSGTNGGTGSASAPRQNNPPAPPAR